MTANPQSSKDSKRSHIASLRFRGLFFLAGSLLAVTTLAEPDSKPNEYSFRRETIEETLDVAEVLAGFPVRFCLLTKDDRQVVAYYDKARQMTVASRTLGSDQWQTQVLPSRIGWDSHNYVTMAIDHDGQLHVSGNMHNVPLIYFRTEKAGDISTLKQYAMTGKLEDRVTYPKFLKDHRGELIFTYRHGGSGNGNTIYNRYNRKKHFWTRLLDTPLFDGEGRRNAYPLGPVRGPDGWFHVVWVWRDTPDCATNHHLSYVRSRDLIHWESAFGEPVKLPIKMSQKELWVDPIPIHGGIINGGEKLAFGADNRPIITYHKSDEKGNMQIYAARPAEKTWAVHQLTDWNKPVVFGGRGSMGFIGIRVSEVIQAEPGVLTMTYQHQDYGEGQLVMDAETLKPLNRTLPAVPEFPKEMTGIQSDYPGMGIQRVSDIGNSDEAGVRYLLQWETFGRNYDRARKPPLPKPSMLKLYKLKSMPSKE